MMVASALDSGSTMSTGDFAKFISQEQKTEAVQAQGDARRKAWAAELEARRKVGWERAAPIKKGETEERAEEGAGEEEQEVMEVDWVEAVKRHAHERVPWTQTQPTLPLVQPMVHHR